MAEHDATYKRAKGHHFLQHDLPRRSQKAVLTLIGAKSIREALDWLHDKKPADLRVALKLRPSQYFPLGQKAIGKKRSPKAGLVSSPSTSSADYHYDDHAVNNSGLAEGQPVRKSTRISKRRSSAILASTGEQPSTPTAVEVDAAFNYRSSIDQSAEEGNGNSEIPIASLESAKIEPANSGDNADGEGFTSSLSSPSIYPRFAMPSPFASAPIPPSITTDALKLLSSRGRGAHTKDSAAEVAEIVAAKRRLKSFLPGCPLASEDQVSAVLSEAFMQVTAGAPSAEYIHDDPVQPSVIVGSNEEHSSIVVVEGENNTAATATDAALKSLESEFLPEEEDDKIFMNLNPLVVDMDMALMPDGGMW